MSMQKLLRWLVAGLGVLAGSVAAAAQETSVAAALASLNARAGVVFSGEVVQVQRVGGVVEVSFRVEHALKGTVGSAYVLREWGGLWAAGQQRYRVGERALMFLHAGAEGSGLSSPVDGMEGVLPEARGGATPAFDVSRVRTRLLRVAGEPMAGTEATMSLDEIAEVLHVQLPVSSPPVRPRLPVLPPPAAKLKLQGAHAR